MKIRFNQKSFLYFIKLTSTCEHTVSLKVSIIVSTVLGFALNLFDHIMLPLGADKLIENWILPATGSARILTA